LMDLDLHDGPLDEEAGNGDNVPAP
jgi:hypothetical protein